MMIFYRPLRGLVIVTDLAPGCALRAPPGATFCWPATQAKTGAPKRKKLSLRSTQCRGEMEADLKELKNSLEEHKQRADRLREREIQVSSQLRDERAKLDGLQGKADAVERELEKDIESLSSGQKHPNDGKRD
jgi:chromosome segregation ATPase